MSYGLVVGCVQCGGELIHRSGSAPMEAGRMVRAVADCPSCRVEHRMTVILQTTVLSEAPERVALCGTQSGYARHRRLGEGACKACLAANADARRRSKARARGAA